MLESRQDYTEWMENVYKKMKEIRERSENNEVK